MMASGYTYRTRSEAGSPAEERRPFRNVEVRKLATAPAQRFSAIVPDRTQ